MSKPKKWVQTILPMHPESHWSVESGCLAFVADHGAIRFDYPETWVVMPGEGGAIDFYDKEPPDGNSVLTVSYITLPPFAVPGFTLAMCMEEAARVDPRPIYEFGPMHEIRRGSMAIVWRQARYIDETEKRDAVSRTCIARKGRIQALLTFEYWADAAECSERAWDIILKTLRLGELVIDVTRGPWRGKHRGRG
ncbi:MAG: hypothetical protein NZ585_11295 [Chloracidobacterium sp.]|nr:hypothetical protein [Chloracidobacterium sp.]MDW8218162.1 hypothetical protein [Acidobacteriota bacterium]